MVWVNWVILDLVWRVYRIVRWTLVRHIIWKEVLVFRIWHVRKVWVVGLVVWYVVCSVGIGSVLDSGLVRIVLIERVTDYVITDLNLLTEWVAFFLLTEWVAVTLLRVIKLRTILVYPCPAITSNSFDLSSIHKFLFLIPLWAIRVIQRTFLVPTLIALTKACIMLSIDC